MRPHRILSTLTVALVASLGFSLLAALTSSSPPEAQAALRKNVDTDYTLLRRDARSYVIGTAYRGWTFDVHGPAKAGYRWGRVFGDVNTCLWIYEGAVTGSGATSDSCGAARIMPVSEFTNGQIGGSDIDGRDGGRPRLHDVRRRAPDRLRERPPLAGPGQRLGPRADVVDLRITGALALRQP